MSLPAKYDFRLTEKNQGVSYWKKIIQKSSISFQNTLLLPPPNITGNLHLGHALDSVIQDFLVRFSYLNKDPIYWIAGIDHAGISTQSKIESLRLPQLNNDEKKREYTLQTWYPQSRRVFYQQWEKLGLLIDYEKASFTLDPIIQKQVRAAFIKLYHDGLIYRGTRIVNWDPKLKSVISDIELEHRTTVNKLYYLKYSLADSNEYLLVATSRPETIFADVALLVNPHDQRYQKYLGQQVRHPWSKKLVPILADESVKIDFGSGVLKCTPGHDFQDYELGKKYQLPIISCCDEKGILNGFADHWQNQEIISIRESLVNELSQKGICMKAENYETNLVYSSKSGALIEPLLSQQWFLDLASLINQVEEKQPNFLEKISFIPPYFRKALENWRDKSQEWCLSRQLWWGHKIPAWHNQRTDEVYVGEELKKCFCIEYRQTHPNIKLEHNCSLRDDWKPETDVLDTWFSSGLWPLISLAKEGENFPSPSANYYPITTLITGYDILFFWVLKMLLLGTYFTNVVPFQQILLHGLIRDEKGRKMSKSLGNGIEPDMLIEKYGADSLRLFLCENNIWGSDLVYQEKKIIGSWRFCQKLWSIANLITSKLSAEKLRKINKADLKKNDNLVNQWILHKLAILQKSYFNHLKENKREINLITTQLIEFAKESLSSNYLELIKISPWDEKTEDNLLFVYQQLLIMFHPIIPFITEYIYQELTGEKILTVEIEGFEEENDSKKVWKIDCLLLLISKVRNFQRKNDINEFYLELMLEWENEWNSPFNFNYFLEPLTKSKVTLLAANSKQKTTNFFLDLQPFGTLWYQKQIGNKELEKKLLFYERECKRSKQLLENSNFRKKAPPYLIEEEQKKLVYYQKQKRAIAKELKKTSNHDHH